MGVNRGVSILIVICFLLINIASADIIISDANVSYDSDLLRVFNDSSFVDELMNQENFVGIKILDDKPFVRVTVFLKDDSGIEVAGTKEEKRELTDQKISWFSQEIDKLLRIIPETEIQEVDKTPEGFHALLSEDALQTLIDNKNILKISWEQYKPRLINSEGNPNKTLLILILVLVFLLIILISFLYKFKNKKRNMRK